MLERGNKDDYITIRTFEMINLSACSETMEASSLKFPIEM